MNSAGFKNSLVGVLLFLFLLHSANQIWLFGWDQGTYFWFCNLALLFGAICVHLQRKDLLLILLSVLIPTQFFWIFDHIKRSLTGTDFFGITEALYHPAASQFEFLLGHYHYFLIPILLFAFFNMPSRRPALLKSLLALALIILPISYYLFPEDQNINCARVSCFDALPSLQGKAYLIAFTVMILVLSYGTGVLLKRFLLPITLAENTNRKIFIILLSIGALFTTTGYFRKRSVPKFSCKAPYEDATIRVRCEFLTEHIPNWMVLHYELKNKTDALQECSSFIEFEGKKELFQDNLTVEANSPLKLSILIHYPSKDTDISLSATCKPL